MTYRYNPYFYRTVYVKRVFDEKKVEYLLKKKKGKTISIGIFQNLISFFKYVDAIRLKIKFKKKYETKPCLPELERKIHVLTK